MKTSVLYRSDESRNLRLEERDISSQEKHQVLVQI